jgi:hypothetical protein
MYFESDYEIKEEIIQKNLRFVAQYSNVELTVENKNQQ